MQDSWRSNLSLDYLFQANLFLLFFVNNNTRVASIQYYVPSDTTVVAIKGSFSCTLYWHYQKSDVCIRTKKVGPDFVRVLLKLA